MMEVINGVRYKPRDAERVRAKMVQPPQVETKKTAPKRAAKKTEETVEPVVGEEQ